MKEETLRSHFMSFNFSQKYLLMRRGEMSMIFFFMTSRSLDYSILSGHIVRQSRLEYKDIVPQTFSRNKF